MRGVGGGLVGGLIGSTDPAQPFRRGWHQVSAVNYSAPSEHRSHERWGFNTGPGTGCEGLECSICTQPCTQRSGGAGIGVFGKTLKESKAACETTHGKGHFGQ